MYRTLNQKELSLTTEKHYSPCRDKHMDDMACLYQTPVHLRAQLEGRSPRQIDPEASYCNVVPNTSSLSASDFASKTSFLCIPRTSKITASMNPNVSDLTQDTSFSRYYNLLQVDQKSSPADISRAYRKLALRYHPDKNPKNQQAAACHFHLIAHAYAILSDPEQRRRYDLYGPTLKPIQNCCSILSVAPFLASVTVGFSTAGAHGLGWMHDFRLSFGLQVGCILLTSLLHNRMNVSKKALLHKAKAELESVSDYFAVTCVGLVFGNLSGWISASAWMCLKYMTRSKSI
uniref:Uncharacterized protein AlNc14C114G6475 n=1 Tax=Albugo laibachii Nc14 TaxID=890382 RepID=F0WIU0_9STRA|nr:conserved hypothetical protein [Albugo laibachii Nc14]|eukprot:CCA21184.1 conserved hypothetical protein [Albugo laibachii Nc14]